MPVENDRLFPLGIIAGRGILPVELANISRALGEKSYIACIDTEIDKVLVDEFEHRFFSIGNVGDIIEYFKSRNVKNIVLAGKIIRPNLAALKVDMTGALLMTKILKQKFLGDDKLLQVVAKFLEGKGFNIVSANDIFALESAKVHLSTIKKPSKQDKIDIEIGLNAARTLGTLDIGQAVLVQDGYILGVEAAEGTDMLIERCATSRKKPYGGVLVKVMKPNQDPRLDIPSIGKDTIEILAKFKYEGVAIEAGKVIIIDRASTFKTADENQVFIYEV